MDVAFLGLGRMGAAMAAHVARSPHSLTVWNRSPGKAGRLTALGAREAGSVADAVRGADAVVLMLADPAAVRDVLGQVVDTAAPGTLVVDASTIGPDAAREFAETAHKAGLAYVDAPVAGSVKPATDGTLGVLAGGSDVDVERARPLLELWGQPDKVQHVGPVGAASALKLVSNLGLGLAAAGIGESLRLARELGVDEHAAMTALSTGAFGWTLGQKQQMVTDDDYSATTFSLALLVKDLRLAADSIDLPVTDAVIAEAAAAVEAGHGDEDYAALIGSIRG